VRTEVRARQEKTRTDAGFWFLVFGFRSRSEHFNPPLASEDRMQQMLLPLLKNLGRGGPRKVDLVEVGVGGEFWTRLTSLSSPYGTCRTHLYRSLRNLLFVQFFFRAAWDLGMFRVSFSRSSSESLISLSLLDPSPGISASSHSHPLPSLPFPLPDPRHPRHQVLPRSNPLPKLHPPQRSRTTSHLSPSLPPASKLVLHPSSLPPLHHRNHLSSQSPFHTQDLCTNDARSTATLLFPLDFVRGEGAAD